MAEELPVYRRHREQGQGQRRRRVNLRLSAAEQAELQRAATLQRETLAGYAAAAALSLARDDLPPSLQVTIRRVFAFEGVLSRIGRDIKELAQHAPSEDRAEELAATIGQLRSTMDAAEDVLEEFAEMMRAERRRKARRARREQRAAANPAAAIEEDQDDEDDDEEEGPGAGAVDVVEFEEWYEP